MTGKASAEEPIKCRTSPTRWRKHSSDQPTWGLEKKKVTCKLQTHGQYSNRRYLCNMLKRTSLRQKVVQNFSWSSQREAFLRNSTKYNEIQSSRMKLWKKRHKTHNSLSRPSWYIYVHVFCVFSPLQWQKNSPQTFKSASKNFCASRQ